MKFPGQNVIDVGRNDLYASPEYIANANPEYDYGLILLPGLGDCNDGFGWSAIVENRELDNRFVTNCGFPGDKPLGTMWISGGKVTTHTNKVFSVDITRGGKSGSPVYTWYSGYWTVLGVHSQGPNSATRFTVEMIFRFLQRMLSLKVQSIRSVAFPNVYIRCDGSGVNGNWSPGGGGTVNCQCKPPRSFERFFIYPVEMTPSLAQEGISKVVIESVRWANVFIRMDSIGMSKFVPSGAGVVNCQFTADSWEVFVLRKEPNGYSFRNAFFSNCYIRVDGSGVDFPIDNGGGVVNCQFYDDPSSPAMEREIFQLEELA